MFLAVFCTHKKRVKEREKGGGMESERGREEERVRERINE